MYILTVSGKEENGAYAVENEDGEKTLFMFEEQDDAERYAMMLSMADEDYPVLDVVEVEEEVAIKACEMYDYCLLYTSPSPRDGLLSRMPSSA